MEWEKSLLSIATIDCYCDFWLLPLSLSLKKLVSPCPGTCHKSPSYKLYFGTHTHTRTFHFIYIESCTVILYRCAQIEQMYCTSLYTTLHCLHTPVVHALCLYCCTSSLCTPVLILTNESTTIITRLIRIDQSQLRIWIGSR